MFSFTLELEIKINWVNRKKQKNYNKLLKVRDTGFFIMEEKWTNKNVKNILEEHIKDL